MNCLEDKKTKLVSLKELLSNTTKYGQNCYRIPDYQRGYAWSSQLEDLWKDIIRILKNGGNNKHYTGMLSLEKIKDEDKEKEHLVDTNAFYIVDGQQRLTSLIIIIKSLTEYIKGEINEDLEEDILSFNNGNTYRFGYSVDRSDDAENYFESRIYMGEEYEVYSDMYLKNINYAKEYIDLNLLQYDAEEAKKILRIVLNQIVFNIYFIDDEFDVRVTFETMNTRGKKLSNLELLKNRLMYLTTLFNENHMLNQKNREKIINPNYEGMLKKQINDAWKEIYENIYYKKEQFNDEVDDDIYLQAHWIVYSTLDKSKGNTYIKDILERKFSIDDGDFFCFIENKNYDGAFNYISRYIKNLRYYSKFWKIINRPIENSNYLSSDEVKWLDRLNRITTMKYIKPVIMVIAGEKDLYANQKIKFYKKLEKNLFINRLLYHSKNDYSSLITGAKAVLNASKDEKIKTFNELIKLLENKNSELYCYDIDKIVTKFSEYINEKKDFYYGWDGINYFLYEYNESLSYNNNTKEIDWKKSSIEHILPQTPTREYWRIILKNIKNENDINVITNSLGNLLLLSKGENSELQNFSFPTKKDKSVASNKYAYKLGSRSAQKVAENQYWSLNNIYKRQIELFEFMYDRWIKVNDSDYLEETENQPIELIQQIDITSFIELLKKNQLILNEYKDLTNNDKKILDNLNYSDEENFFKRNKIQNEEEWYKGIESVFNKNICEISKNQRNIQYIENRFTFTKIDEYLKCGTKIDNKKIYFEYNYNNGFIKIIIEKNLQNDDKNLPEKAKYFLRTFNRFLRRQEGKNDAIIYNDNIKVES